MHAILSAPATWRAKPYKRPLNLIGALSFTASVGLFIWLCSSDLGHDSAAAVLGRGFAATITFSVALECFLSRHRRPLSRQEFYAWIGFSVMLGLLAFSIGSIFRQDFAHSPAWQQLDHLVVALVIGSAVVTVFNYAWRRRFVS